MIRLVLRDGRQMLVPEADVLVWAELIGDELVTLERVHGSSCTHEVGA